MLDFTPSATVLKGIPYERAVLLGMPHLTNPSDESESCRCVLCNKPASSVPLFASARNGKAALDLHGVEIVSPSVDLCVGCRRLYESQGLYTISWQWLDVTVERQWWSGQLFEDGLKPHDPVLYAFGRYVIYRGEDVYRVVRDA